jgi:hypothetical protein
MKTGDCNVIQFWSTIIGVIVGGIIAIGGGFVQRICERRQERKSLRAGLGAEIQAILDIVGRRDYIEGLSKFIEAIKGGATNLFQVRVGKDYDTVFKSNCGKLGLLPSETAAKTVRFYYLVSSIVEDLDLLRDAADSAGLQTRYGLNTQRGNLAFHEQMQQLSIETIALGNDLTQELV